MAGSKDHLVPTDRFYDQAKSLSNARSVTMRLFTRDEGAQNHCQVGNYGLALRTIVTWLNAILLEDTHRRGSVGAASASGPEK